MAIIEIFFSELA